MIKINVHALEEAVPENVCIVPQSLQKLSGMVFKFPNRKLRVYGGCLD
jgi:uncharacterized protein YjeT (DUF2065 family)